MPYTTKHRAFVETVPDEGTDTTLLYHLISHQPGAGFIWRQLAEKHQTLQVQDVKTEEETGRRGEGLRTRTLPRVTYYGSIIAVQVIGEDEVTAEVAATSFREEVQHMLEEDAVFGIKASSLPGVQRGHGWPPLSFIEFWERFRTDGPQPGEDIGKQDFREPPYGEQYPRGLFGMDYEA